MMTMKMTPTKYRITLAGLMALLLTTCTVNAAEEWPGDFRHCYLQKTFAMADLDIVYGGDSVVAFITSEDLGALTKGLAMLRQCQKFWACVNRRDEGKVRHCFLLRSGRTVVR